MLYKKISLIVVAVLALAMLITASGCCHCLCNCWNPLANPSIDVEAFVGCDYTGSWSDVDEAPGVEGVAGIHWSFKYIVTNTGDVELTNITLTDSYLGPVSLPGDTLLPGDYFEVVLPHAGPGILGQYTSEATATGDYNGVTYMDTDYLNYYGYLP